MSSPSKKAAFALQDILLGIADGLNSAQNSLKNMEPYDAYGRPNTMYQLPYLDFSLQVTSEFQESSSGQSSEKMSYMRFEPARRSTQTNEKTEVYSTISGRFLASVPNEGLPQILIQIKTSEPVKRYSKYEVEIEVFVGNAAGEVMPNSKVEFNYDSDLSDSLRNGTISTSPTFTKSEIYTDSQGICKTVLKIPVVDFEKGYYTAVQVNTGTTHKMISISKH